MVKFSNTTPLPSRICWGGMNIFLIPTLSMKYFNDGGGLSFYKYLQTKHKKWILSTTIHLTRKKLIYSGRYLNADHFGKQLDRGVGHSKMLKGGSLKLIMSNLTYKLQTFTKHYIGHGNE